MDIFLLVITGIVTGTLSGLYGIGGGMIVVPALVFILPHIFPDISADLGMRMAVGTSLAIMVGTSFSALMSHYRLGSVGWSLFRRFYPGMILGSILGAIIADYLSANVLRVFFGIFLVVIAMRSFLVKQKIGVEKLPGHGVLFLVSNIVGILSVLLGVGAGSICVPFFLRCKIAFKKASGTASACSLLAAILGSFGFVVTGVEHEMHVVLPWSTGYIYWPAFLAVGALSVIFAPVGVRLSHQLPSRITQPVFAGILFLIGLRMAII